MAALNS